MRWLYFLSAVLIGYLEGSLGLWHEELFWSMVTIGRVVVGLLVLFVSYQFFYLLLPLALAAFLFWDETLFVGLGVSALFPLILIRSQTKGLMLAAYLFGIGIGVFLFTFEEAYWIAISVFLLNGILMICDRHPRQEKSKR